MTNNLVFLNSSQMYIPESIEDCALDYESLSHAVKTLAQQHSELKSNIRALKSPIHKIYRKIKRRLFGHQEHSVDEVINFQLSVIRQIRANLESQAQRGRKKLEFIVNYSTTQGEMLESSNSYKYNEGPLIIKEKQEIESRKEELLREDKTKPGYYKKEQEIKERARGYHEHLHKYDLAARAVKDILAQRQHTDCDEAILRYAVHSSEVIIAITKRIEGQMSAIRGAYDCVLKQYKSYPHLVKALDNQHAYISNIDGVLADNQSTMEAIANSPETIKPSYSTSRLEAMVETMQISSELRREEVENNSTSVFTE